jgi:hypothetical protein
MRPSPEQQPSTRGGPSTGVDLPGSQRSVGLRRGDHRVVVGLYADEDTDHAAPRMQQMTENLPARLVTGTAPTGRPQPVALRRERKLWRWSDGR